MSFYTEYRQRYEAADSDIWQHLPRLYEAAYSYDRVQVLELGTRGGESTRALLAGAELRGGHVWSVDIAQPRVPAGEWEATGLWSYTVADDLEVEIPDGYRPHVLFIDTSHEVVHTIAELRRFGPLVREGGVILCHDTEFGPPEFPVAEALNLYCFYTGVKWTNYPGCFGLGVIECPNG